MPSSPLGWAGAHLQVTAAGGLEGGCRRNRVSVVTVVLTGAEGPSVAPFQSKHPPPGPGEVERAPSPWRRITSGALGPWPGPDSASRKPGLGPRGLLGGPGLPGRVRRAGADARCFLAAGMRAGRRGGQRPRRGPTCSLRPEATGTPVLSSTGHVAIRKQARSTERQRHCQKSQMQCRAGRARGQGFGIWGC